MPVPTCHFPSSYNLLCCDLDQSYELYRHKTSIHDFFHKGTEKDETWFWNMFARPVKEATRTQHLFSGYSWYSSDRDRSPLERLPTELIDLILESLVDGYSITWLTRLDILALGLASKFLYPVVLAHIHRSQTKQQPPSFLAVKNVGFYADTLVPKIRESYRFQENLSTEGWAQPNHFPTQPDQQWCQSIAEVRKKWNVLDKKQWRLLEQDVSKMYMYPQDLTWVLRNFTTRQIVRSDTLTPPAGIVPLEARSVQVNKGKAMMRRLKDKLSNRQNGSPKYPQVSIDHLTPTLAQILLVRATWSDDISMLSDRIHTFQYGVWSEHSFDVVTLEEHLASLNGTRWTDVSALVAADVGHLRWCVGQAEIAKTWPEHEEEYWQSIIRRDRQQWRRLPEKALRYATAGGHDEDVGKNRCDSTVYRPKSIRRLFGKSRAGMRGRGGV